MKQLTKKVLNDRLHYLYTNPKSNVRFSRKELLLKELIKLLKTQNYEYSLNLLKTWVNEWYKQQDTAILHKPVKRKFKRSYMVVAGVGSQLQMDLISLQNQADDNIDLFKMPGNSRPSKKPMKYILVIIDVFSKKAWTYALPNKEGPVLAYVLRNFLGKYKKEETETNGGISYPRTIQTDKGTEFLNSNVQNLFAEHSIKFFQTDNPETKASVVERFNRTLMSYINKYYTWQYSKNKMAEAKKKRGTKKLDWRAPYRWVDVIDSVVDNYNNRYHTSIGMSPNQVSHKNEMEIRAFKNAKKCARDMGEKFETKKFRVGDFVLINIYSSRFRKGYAQQWRDEVYIISKILRRDRRYVYELVDMDREKIRGHFYKEELQEAPKKSFSTGKKWKPTTFGTI